MRTTGPTSRWLVGAVVLATVVALVAAGALVWARRDLDEARSDQERVRRELAVSADADSPDRLAATRAAIASVRAPLDALDTDMQQVVELQRQDAGFVEAALEAGKAGDVPAYNEAVTKRNVLVPQIDAAVEKLRTDGNAVLLALATVTNRIAP